MEIKVNERSYVVAVGTITAYSAPSPLVPVDATAATRPSVPAQDLSVELWTASTAGGDNSERAKVSAVLINTCTTPCSSTTSQCNEPIVPGSASQPVFPEGALPTSCAGSSHLSDPCLVKASSELSYFWISHPTDYPDRSKANNPGVTDWSVSCCGGRKLGDLKYVGEANPYPADCRPTLTEWIRSSIEISDLFILRNHLRSGEFGGSCPALISGIESGPTKCDSCADFNQDGLVNEVDLNILEKYLRGYLYWLPTHFQVGS